MVLVYIAVFTIIINRRPILVMKTTSKIFEIFTQVDIPIIEKKFSNLK